MTDRVALVPPEPPLQDDAVMLRTWLERDIPQIVAACQDPSVHRYIRLPDPYTTASAEEYVARTHREWADGTKAAFAVVDLHSSSLVLGSVNLAVTPPAGNAAYWVVPGARGHGVAQHALRLITDWALHGLGLGVVLLEIDPSNETSMHVARGAGYHQSGRLDVNAVTGEVDHLLFSKLASDDAPGTPAASTGAGAEP